jgi:hypothetical protein
MSKTTKKKEPAESANKTISMALLDSYRKALYAVRDFFEDAAQQMQTIQDIEVKLKLSLGINNLGEKLGKNIESLDKLEDKVQREQKEAISRRGDRETSLFED